MLGPLKMSMLLLILSSEDILSNPHYVESGMCRLQGVDIIQKIIPW